MIMFQMLDQFVLRDSGAISIAGVRQTLWIEIGHSRPCRETWRD